ncbi:hypothetical protein [Priestia megaterium]|uniref:hypothetical protein n=1 Tax=Priestia megaterium TaxID=1404 RepID=UPI001F22D9BB|nr:hypothetical protein [Priestia megaterium]
MTWVTSAEFVGAVSNEEAKELAGTPVRERMQLKILKKSRTGWLKVFGFQSN